MRYDNKNPAELYPGTTWELLASDKYIRTGATALSTGGSNSISIAKTNLPNIKLQIESFSMTRGTMDITGNFRVGSRKMDSTNDNTYGAFKTGSCGQPYNMYDNTSTNGRTYQDISFTASNSWTGTTSNASPYTNPLGNGTALSIQPAYITLKFWKRLT